MPPFTTLSYNRQLSHGMSSHWYSPYRHRPNIAAVALKYDISVAFVRSCARFQCHIGEKHQQNPTGMCYMSASCSQFTTNVFTTFSASQVDQSSRLLFVSVLSPQTSPPPSLQASMETRFHCYCLLVYCLPLSCSKKGIFLTEKCVHVLYCLIKICVLFDLLSALILSLIHI